MSKTILSVPESLTRAQYLAVLEPLGIDVHDLISLTFARDGVRAVVFARDEYGQRVIDCSPGAEHAFQQHTIFVPVVDEENGR